MSRTIPAAVVGAAACVAAAADWPTYRGDAARSGYTPAAIVGEPVLRWVYRPRHVPRPAWPRSTRLRDDRTHPVVAAGGRVYFGSTTDGRVRALDAATGRAVWSFATGAPVRYAPTAWTPPGGEARLFAVSDDGFLYCLAAATGRLLWKRRGGAGRDMLLGGGRMISRWPARGAPVVVDGVVYFGAGIWPSEGIYLYALDAATGRTLWCNDEGGDLEMPQPHGGAWARSGLSAQGYLAVAGEQLLVPTGRAVPAAIDRRDGALRHFHLQRHGKLGGSAVAVAGQFFLNGDAVFELRNGLAVCPDVPTRAAAGPPGRLVYCRRGKVCVVDLSQAMTTRKIERFGRTFEVLAPNVQWSAEVPIRIGSGGGAVIVAGRWIVCGGRGKVVAVDVDARNQVWSAAVAGEALALAAAGGQLFVSTDRGAIYCFGEPPAEHRATAAGPGAAATNPARQPRPYGANAAFAAAAEEILRTTGVREGYCVDLACGDGALAYELARRSALRIYGVDADAGKVAAARRKLLAAGLYGVRVTVHRADPSRTPYPDYFADLAVSARGVQRGGYGAAAPEMLRLLGPGGGVACLGPPGSMRLTRRPPLAGAGTWTHQYADAANTACGDDALVRGPLAVLWFHSADLGAPDRHGRPHAPLCDGRRLFVEGLDALRALDAYNGRLLWKYRLAGVLKPYDQEHIMGTAGTGANFCLGAGGVFVHTGRRCVRLDAASGRKLREYAAPELPDGRGGRWGYIAFRGGTLFGTLVNAEHVVPYRFRPADMSRLFTESRVLFALDSESGRQRWRYVADQSIRHNAIAVAGARVYLIDREPAAETPGLRRLAKPQPPGVLVALDADTGCVVWKNEKDIYGTMLAVSEPHDVLLMAYQCTRFRLNSEVGGRLTALRASTGRRLWDVRTPYLSRPVIVGRTVFAQPYAWDLLTGGRRTLPADGEGGTRPWVFRRSYGCGIVSAARNLLLFRSATLGYRDLLADRPTANYGGIRPGCWINAVPAAGLVLMPDETEKCTCSYLNKATMALKPLGAWPPRIDPAGGAFRQAVGAAVNDAPKGAEIRYTLDGTPPQQNSPRCEGAISIAKTCKLRARAFREGRAVSAVARARFVIDPTVVPLADRYWRIWDAPGARGGPSRWTVQGDTATQHSNIFTGSAGPAKCEQPRYGTLRILREPLAGPDGRLRLQLRSRDNDMLGVAVRFRDVRHHYLWAMDCQRGMHVLACRNGDEYKVLASNAKAYRPGRWHTVEFIFAGPRITVVLDGNKDLEAVDETFSEGAIALHVWGNAATSFRAIRWFPRRDEPD